MCLAEGVVHLQFMDAMIFGFILRLTLHLRLPVLFEQRLFIFISRKTKKIFFLNFVFVFEFAIKLNFKSKLFKSKYYSTIIHFMKKPLLKK